jgi:hypothetical protein
VPATDRRALEEPGGWHHKVGFATGQAT